LDDLQNCEKIDFTSVSFDQIQNDSSNIFGLVTTIPGFNFTLKSYNSIPEDIQPKVNDEF